MFTLLYPQFIFLEKNIAELSRTEEHMFQTTVFSQTDVATSSLPPHGRRTPASPPPRVHTCCVSHAISLTQTHSGPLSPCLESTQAAGESIGPLSSLCPSTPPCPLTACPRWNSTLLPPSSKLAAPTRRLTAALSTHPPCHRLPIWTTSRALECTPSPSTCCHRPFAPTVAGHLSKPSEHYSLLSAP